MMACAWGVDPTAIASTPTPGPFAFDGGRTAFGIFPSPPEMTTDRLLDLLHAMGEHGDVALIQRALPWSAFLDSPDGTPWDFTDEQNLVTLLARLGLEPIFVVDPLNGLDRRQSAVLPAELRGG
jgi:hypothetical protein